MLEAAITERYRGEAETDHLGCANLKPYLDIREGDFILDLGCGNGGQTVLYADLAGKSGFAAGIDLTSAMVEKARARETKNPVEFRTGDIHQLPYSDGFFHRVISNCVINHSPDKKKVYSEIFRVLRGGGVFIVGDVMAQERLPESVSGDLEAVAACWGGAIQKEDYLRIIENCGFQDVKILQSRRYFKNGYGLESVVIRGEKP